MFFFPQRAPYFHPRQPAIPNGSTTLALLDKLTHPSSVIFPWHSGRQAPESSCASPWPGLSLLGDYLRSSLATAERSGRFPLARAARSRSFAGIGPSPASRGPLRRLFQSAGSRFDLRGAGVSIQERRRARRTSPSHSRPTGTFAGAPRGRLQPFHILQGATFGSAGGHAVRQIVFGILADLARAPGLSGDLATSRPARAAPIIAMERHPGGARSPHWLYSGDAESARRSPSAPPVRSAAPSAARTSWSRQLFTALSR